MSRGTCNLQTLKLLQAVVKIILKIGSGFLANTEYQTHDGTRTFLKLGCSGAAIRRFPLKPNRKWLKKRLEFRGGDNYLK